MDSVAITREGFIDGVVDDFVDQVVEAAFSGGADIHSRAFADGVEAFKDGDIAGVVTLLCHRSTSCKFKERAV
jgi:hypothetical protein